METWIRFDELLPAQGQFIAVITQRDGDLLIEDWELDLERNAVGIWIDGEIWEGNSCRKGFTHWVAIPDRPTSSEPSPQMSFWDLFSYDMPEETND